MKKSNRYGLIGAAIGMVGFASWGTNTWIKSEQTTALNLVYSEDNPIGIASVAHTHFDMIFDINKQYLAEVNFEQRNVLGTNVKVPVIVGIKKLDRASPADMVAFSNAYKTSKFNASLITVKGNHTIEEMIAYQRAPR